MGEVYPILNRILILIAAVISLLELQDVEAIYLVVTRSIVSVKGRALCCEKTLLG